MKNHLSSRSKYKIIHEYVKRFNIDTIIETGTYRGGLINELHNKVKRIISIELNSKLYNAVVTKFSDQKNVTLICGDSGQWIKKILVDIDTRCLFWIDAHYCRGGSRTNVDSPIEEELNQINNHCIKNHIILIDDIRLMRKDFAPGYINLDKIKKIMSNYKEFQVKNDIMRIFNLRK